MPVGFSNVVEDVKQLRTDEKEELLLLLTKYLTEERRNEMYKHYQSSLQEVRETKPEFSSDINRLKMMVTE
ncbi:MAG: hypothetical protein GY801_04550 [bacterium]|nr:hypothetical protein [bacterium]